MKCGLQQQWYAQNPRSPEDFIVMLTVIFFQAVKAIEKWPNSLEPNKTAFISALFSYASQ
jgi:hypothetical protein